MGPEEAAEETRAEAYEYYNKLTQAGGRPSRPIQSDPGPWDPSLGDEELHGTSHWEKELRRYMNELERWENFRKYQQAIRKNPEKFRGSIERACEYQSKRGIDVHLDSQFQVEEQTMLDTWKEYYLYEHRKLGPLEASLERALKELGPAKVELKAARLGGSIIPEILEAGQQNREAFRRMSSAQKRVKALESDDSTSAVEIEQAQKEVKSAQKRYEETSKAEILRGIVTRAESGVRVAMLKVEKHMTWLKSIEGQLPAIVSEQAGQSQEEGKQLHGHDRKEEAEMLLVKPMPKVPGSDSSSRDKRKPPSRSILNPVDAAKISKSRPRDGRRQTKQKQSQEASLLTESHDSDGGQSTTSAPNTEHQDSQNEVRGPRIRYLRNHTLAESSRPNGYLKGSDGKKKQSKARSILTPVDPSRVSEASRKKRSPPRQEMSTSSDASLLAEKATIFGGNPQRSSMRISKIKDNISARGLECTSLRPIHSSRVSKLRRASGGEQFTKEKSPVATAGLRPTQLPKTPNTPPRRSTRITKKPDRFCPGQT
ncbi:hypothetical protein MMC08_007238 [Hypocenomyce scalaris]|nr:hypothetical protein [Hypocenomyce scalaris]